MIPEHELQLLTNTMHHAAELAQAGRFAIGYQELSDGVRRTRYLAQSCPSDAAAALHNRWQETLDAYCQRFGVRLEGP